MKFSHISFVDERTRGASRAHLVSYLKERYGVEVDPVAAFGGFDVYSIQDRERLIGVALCGKRPDGLEFHALATHRRMEDRETLVEFLDFLIDRARMAGVKRLVTTVNADNLAAMEATRALGLEPWSEHYTAFGRFVEFKKEVA